MNIYRRILPHELSPADLRCRRWQLGLARRTTWLFGREKLFDLHLRRKVATLSKANSGFAVPTSWGIAAFGPALQFDCPTGQMAMQLADWVGCGERRWHLNDYFLGTGDWKSLTRPSDDTSVAQEAAELKACALDYRGTRAYAELLDALRRGQPVRRQQQLIDTPQKLDSYFERFTALYRAIAAHGVLSCRRLQELSLAEPAERDVGVAINADGKLLRLPGGQHRTAIARVLDLPMLPVEVRLLHVDWLRGVTTGKNCSPFAAVCSGIAALDR